MRAIWKLVILTAVLNFIAILHGFVYGWLTGFLGLECNDVKLVFHWAKTTFLLAIFFLPVAFIFCYQSIDKAIDAITKGASIDQETLEKARRITLDLPVGFARIDMRIWLVAALSFIPIYMVFRPGQLLFPAIHVSMVTILIGGVSTCFVYYASEWYIRKNLIPILFPDGKLSEVEGIDVPSIERKIYFLIVDVCALPVAALTMTALMGAATVSGIVYLGVTFLIIGFLQGVAIKKSINIPIGDVACEMAKVRDGDLSAKVQVSSADRVGLLAEGFNEMVEGLQRGELIRESFGRYVSRDVLEKVLEGEVELFGEQRHSTVLFCDIRDFTTISEQLPPKELLTRLNGWLDIMVDAIVDHGGRVDKFIGDSIMAVFGVPIQQENHSLRAVKAGLDMLERLKYWNEELKSPDFMPWQIGIGIHSGEVIAGNIGSKKKMEYAVIGDVVNTASRIEQLNKKFKTNVLISEETYNIVAHEVEAERLGPETVKGKKIPGVVYRLNGIK